MKRHTGISLLAALICLSLPRAIYSQDMDAATSNKTQQDKDASITAAVTKLHRDIERDTLVLNQLRDQIAADRKPLAERLSDLQKKVKGLRSDVERIRRLQTQGEKEQAALEEQARVVASESEYLLALFSEYARAMETRMTTTDASFFREQLRIAHTSLQIDEDFIGFADAVNTLLSTSANMNKTRLGGYNFEGVALDTNGKETKGRFAVFGPVSYFAGDDTLTGIAMTQSGSDTPAIYGHLPDHAKDAIQRMIAGKEANIPIDVTNGDAIKVAEAKPTFVEHVRQGGFVMIPLTAVALLAFMLSIWKFIELTGVRTSDNGKIAKILTLLKQGDAEGAMAKKNTLREPLRPLVHEAITHRESSRDFLEEVMHEQVLATLPKLERNLGTLAVLGGIAPLLGLLGTVTGMIHTFQLVTIFGSGDAKLLSGGISEALVTTETGLAIAIPVLLMHAFLARRARNIIASLERIAIGMINDITANANHP